MRAEYLICWSDLLNVYEQHTEPNIVSKETADKAVASLNERYPGRVYKAVELKVVEEYLTVRPDEGSDDAARS